MDEEGTRGPVSRGLRRSVINPRPVPRVALTRPEAALALGMSVKHFDRHVKPALRVVYCGGLKLYPLAELERWTDGHASAAPADRITSASP